MSRSPEVPAVVTVWQFFDPELILNNCFCGWLIQGEIMLPQTRDKFFPLAFRGLGRASGKPFGPENRNDCSGLFNSRSLALSSRHGH